MPIVKSGWANTRLSMSSTKRFEVTPDMLAQLVATGKEMGVEYNEEEYQKGPASAEVADESIDSP